MKDDSSSRGLYSSDVLPLLSHTSVLGLSRICGSLHSWQFISIWFSRNRQLSWSKKCRRCLQATQEVIDGYSAQCVSLLPGASVSWYIHGKVEWNHPEGLCSFDHLGFKVLMWISVDWSSTCATKEDGFCRGKTVTLRVEREMVKSHS